MGFFRRISDLITPPPSQSDVVRHDTPAPSEPDAAVIGRLLPELQKLITAEDMNSPEAVLAIAELKRIGGSIGLYVAAAKMRFFLDSKRTDGQVIHKDRGYVLAADFIFQHVNRELQDMDAEGHEIGPNVFRSYCNELVACLVSGKNVRRAIEVPMMLIDTLLERALSATEQRDTYLSLIRQGTESAYDQVLAKYEADQRERARRRQERRTESGSNSNSSIEDPAHCIDGGVVEFLKETGERIAAFSKAFSMCTAVPVPVAGSAPPDAHAGQQNLNYLQQVAPLAEKAGYYGLIAIVSRQVAATLAITNSERQAEFWLRSAMANELQADHESKLLLFKLAKRRYTAAQDAYMKAGDVPRATSVGRKMG